jgi:hypothetical protein
MSQDALALITKFVFTFSYSVFFSAVLRAANDWFPFSPTFTSENGRWVGWPDLLRWFFSGVLLFIAPVIFMVFVLVRLSAQPPPVVIPTAFPTVREAIAVIVLLSLALVPLGLYDLWQTIVRRWPGVFYSEWARRKIQEKHKSAFTAGLLQTLGLACLWSLAPTACFLFIAK